MFAFKLCKDTNLFILLLGLRLQQEVILAMLAVLAIKAHKAHRDRRDSLDL